MNREILFRGKRIDGKGWLESKSIDHWDDGRVWLFCADEGDMVEVIPETVGQYTGQKDKAKKRIFDGDILKVKSFWKKAMEVSQDGGVRGNTFWTVEYRDFSTECGFFTYGIDRRWHKPLTWSRLYNAEAEVCGNIHDTPELLEERK